jgi:hypothetical protein
MHEEREPEPDAGAPVPPDETADQAAEEVAGHAADEAADARADQAADRAADEPPASRSRRWFLAGAAAVVLGAGGGVGAGVLRHRPRPVRHRPPGDLLAARAAELRLLADVRATAHADASAAARLRQVTNDHEQHLRVIDVALARFDPPTPAARRRAAGRRSRPADTVAALLAAERAAAGAAAERAGRLAPADPALATVFASIAACETTHAELLA